MAKLSKRVVDTLDGRATDYFRWDDDLPGFGVRVWPSGSKKYVAQYRAGGRTRRFKIGDHGRLTVEQARREAKGILGDVARGHDPADDRATRRKTLTVRALCEAYFAAADQGLIAGKGGRPKKASTLATDRGRVDRHVVPLLGNKLVIELTQADLSRFVRDVSSGKTAVVEKTTKLRGKAVVDGGAGTAARTVGLLGGILSFAISEGVIENNPARGVKRPADKSRGRRLTAQEYRALGSAIEEAEAAGEAWQGIVGARLLALTGCRLSEAMGLEWSEVDFPGHCLRLADSKEGRSVRALGQAAISILGAITRSDDVPYVLPSIRGEQGHHLGMPGALGRLTARAGLTGVTAHTLRHSFASVAGDLGFTESTIAALLGHTAGSVTSRYIHHLDAVLIAAADKIANTIGDAMNAPPQPSDDSKRIGFFDG